MNKCPRCKLPQNGIYKCQYCGYDLNKYNKKHATIIRKRLKGIIGELKESKIFSNNKKSKVHSMNNAGKAFKKKDEWRTRSGTDRRKNQYATYFPERRSGVGLCSTLLAGSILAWLAWKRARPRTFGGERLPLLAMKCAWSHLLMSNLM